MTKPGSSSVSWSFSSSFPRLMRWAFALLCFQLQTSTSDAFTTPASALPSRRHISCSALDYSAGKGGDDDSIDAEVLRRRIETLRLQIAEEEWSRPPNRKLQPQDVIRTVLDGLFHHENPVPDAGFRLLMRASTPKWRRYILRSIGAPIDAIRRRSDVLASALGTAMGRPNNQFAILVGYDSEDQQQDRPYVLDFDTSSEPLDWGDGTCWVECRLRDPKSQKLLVIMGWDFVKDDGAWLIDGITWQDFRDEYRPGIGREEWVRICG